MAISDSGVLFSWGRGSEGQLGRPPPLTSKDPSLSCFSKASTKNLKSFGMETLKIEMKADIILGAFMRRNEITQQFRHIKSARIPVVVASCLASFSFEKPK